MAQDDFHPADDLAKAVQGLFNGKNLMQAIRDGWDKHFGPSQPAQSTDSTIQQMNKSAADKTAADVAQSYRDNAAKQAITPTAAANIRAKAGKAMGK